MEQNSDVSPMEVFSTINSFHRSAALKAGIELGVFTKIAEGSKTAKAIAEACEAAERGVRILCDSLAVIGFLTKTGDEYDLREDAAVFLNRNSPAYMGTAVDFLMSPMLMDGFVSLTDAVRQGGTAIPDEGSVAPENPVWVKFARSMMPMMMPAAEQMAENLPFERDKQIKVLDIAAGHGIFGIKMAQRFPNAEIYALDWKNVLEVAKENAEKFGVSERYRTIEGSAFDADFGADYDVVLLTNFLHHFDAPTNEKLLRKIYDSLDGDGKVLTLEFVPNDDRISPPGEALFSLIMLSSTPSGDAYTFAELKQMFQNAGFSASEHHPLSPSPQHLIISTK
ncbi:MAG TPA: class I SAM-dependent methyltransferase [Pyrinomonadaceae bacterium]|jgi:ubiquinone/menaquinone biosynthesis C-methylase UbiE